nr:MAG TPA: hypothetical protein [Caudoviricetes sp.]
MLVNGSDFYCGNSSGSPCQFALKNQIPSAYTHPSEKQCNYSVDLSGYAKTSDLESLKTSVSSGKSIVATAVTGKGVSTAANASFQTIASNIRNIPGMKTNASVEVKTNKGLLANTSAMVYKIKSFDGTSLICAAIVEHVHTGPSTYEDVEASTLTFALT